MEQKKRRFNVVDIIAVVLILAVLAFAGTKLMSRGGSGAAVEQTKIPVTYLAKAEGVDARRRRSPTW